jgi:hypothetical protein
LELNNEIAALMHKCVRGANGDGGEKESAMVDAGLVSRFQGEEALNVKVLAEQFVLPWTQGLHVHSWLRCVYIYVYISLCVCVCVCVCMYVCMCVCV